MKIIKFIGWFIYVIIYLPSWFPNPFWDRKWNAEVKDMIKNHPIIPYNRFNVDCKGYHIWIANHPYASVSQGGLKASPITTLRFIHKYKKEKMIHEVLGKL